MKRALAVLVAMSFLSVAASATAPKKQTSRVVSKRSTKRSSKRVSSKRGRSKKGGFAKTRTTKGKGAKPVKRAHR